MSRRNVFSTAGQLAGRTIMVFVAAAAIIGCIYLPVRWTGMAEKASQKEDAFWQRMPPQQRERVERDRQRIRDRRATPQHSAGLVLGQFVGVSIFALIGRKVLRLKLGSSGEGQS
jgi:hypothetical protein